ncbi:hypothetical protein J6590_045228 [Homalodisca vitripennis]|nr:hypothetical protein J6590_045228 [Homalodisca vitripennis]
MCEGLLSQNKGESQYSTRSMILVKSATVTDRIRTCAISNSEPKSNVLDRSAIGTPSLLILGQDAVFGSHYRRRVQSGVFPEYGFPHTHCLDSATLLSATGLVFFFFRRTNTSDIIQGYDHNDKLSEEAFRKQGRLTIPGSCHGQSEATGETRAIREL